MRNLIRISFLFGIIVFMAFSCEKEEEMPTDISNIILYDKPLNVIKYCILGRWEVAYGKGGINANAIHYWDNFYMEFTPDNKAIVSWGETVDYANSIISWYQECGGYTGYNECVYIMEINNKYEIPCPYIVDEIYSDTLIIHDFASDAIYYYLTKTK